jgi:hypothetical protein
LEHNLLEKGSKVPMQFLDGSSFPPRNILASMFSRERLPNGREVSCTPQGGEAGGFDAPPWGEAERSPAERQRSRMTAPLSCSAVLNCQAGLQWAFLFRTACNEELNLAIEPL